jgi:hypothetical protein
MTQTTRCPRHTVIEGGLRELKPSRALAKEAEAEAVKLDIFDV